MYKILLVEDDRETASYVKSGLELEEMTVDVAVDGQDGFECFQKNEYDLVLLDLEMPRMNGEELVIKIRNINPYIDIIVYTNYSQFADIKKLVNLGINGYINKGPEADLRELINIVKSKLEPINEDAMKTLINGTDVMKVD
ncbi:MAG: response regulator [Lachnospiraceae bacterium]|jgi:DNA-binding response OmpR family regulator|nr:response regulator [Lachnospiraceae bacterium]